MSLDEQLAELLGRLGVVLEGLEGTHPESATAADPADSRAAHGSDDTRCPECHQPRGAFVPALAADVRGAADAEVAGVAELSLFQTSREHYGVFYRLDLIAGVPQLRIFAPEEGGALKMRCYLIRPSSGSPLRTWFDATRGHDGSPEYEESRETTEQHLLFAAGETLKRLFWSGEPEEMRFPAEITVHRLA